MYIFVVNKIEKKRILVDFREQHRLIAVGLLRNDSIDKSRNELTIDGKNYDGKRVKADTIVVLDMNNLFIPAKGYKTISKEPNMSVLEYNVSSMYKLMKERGVHVENLDIRNNELVCTENSFGKFPLIEYTNSNLKIQILFQLNNRNSTKKLGYYVVITTGYELNVAFVNEETLINLTSKYDLVNAKVVTNSNNKRYISAIKNTFRIIYTVTDETNKNVKYTEQQKKEHRGSQHATKILNEQTEQAVCSALFGISPFSNKIYTRTNLETAPKYQPSLYLDLEKEIEIAVQEVYKAKNKIKIGDKEKNILSKVKVLLRHEKEKLNTDKIIVSPEIKIENAYYLDKETNKKYKCVSNSDEAIRIISISIFQIGLKNPTIYKNVLKSITDKTMKHKSKITKINEKNNIYRLLSKYGLLSDELINLREDVIKANEKYDKALGKNLSYNSPWKIY